MLSEATITMTTLCEDYSRIREADANALNIVLMLVVSFIDLRNPNAEPAWTQNIEAEIWRLLNDTLVHFCDVELDMRVHLQILVVRSMDLVLDVLLQVRHLHHG